MLKKAKNKEKTILFQRIKDLYWWYFSREAKAYRVFHGLPYFVKDKKTRHYLLYLLRKTIDPKFDIVYDANATVKVIEGESTSFIDFKNPPVILANRFDKIPKVLIPATKKVTKAEKTRLLKIDKYNNELFNYESGGYHDCN